MNKRLSKTLLIIATVICGFLAFATAATGGGIIAMSFTAVFALGLDLLMELHTKKQSTVE